MCRINEGTKSCKQRWWCYPVWVIFLLLISKFKVNVISFKSNIHFQALKYSSESCTKNYWQELISRQMLRNISIYINTDLFLGFIFPLLFLLLWPESFVGEVKCKPRDWVVFLVPIANLEWYYKKVLNIQNKITSSTLLYAELSSLVLWWPILDKKQIISLS